jgi:hypothetical protein
MGVVLYLKYKALKWIHVKCESTGVLSAVWYYWKLDGVVLSVAFITWFQLDNLSHKSSGSSLNASQPPISPVVGSLENLAGGEFLRRTSTLQIPHRSVGSTQARPSDEWGQKLCGKQGKGKPVLKMCEAWLNLLELWAASNFPVHCSHRMWIN